MNEHKPPFGGDKEDIIIKAGDRMGKAFRKVLLDFDPNGKNNDPDPVSAKATVEKTEFHT